MSPGTGTEPPGNFVCFVCFPLPSSSWGLEGVLPLRPSAIVYTFQPTGTRRGKGRMSLRLRTHHVCLYLIRVHGQPHLTRKCLAGQPRTILKTENSVTGGETACGASTFLGETSSQAEAEAELGDHWPLLSPGAAHPERRRPSRGTQPAPSHPPGLLLALRPSGRRVPPTLLLPGRRPAFRRRGTETRRKAGQRRTTGRRSSRASAAPRHPAAPGRPCPFG